MAANAPCAVEIVRGKESEHFEQIEAAVASQNTLANVLAARPKKYTDESRQGAAMGLMGSGIR
jgi:hypothetical protein